MARRKGLDIMRVVKQECRILEELPYTNANVTIESSVKNYDITVSSDNIGEEQNPVLFGHEEEEDIKNEEVLPLKIKLRPPKPGSKIATLANIIEYKLYQRPELKPYGGFDPFDPDDGGGNTKNNKEHDPREVIIHSSETLMDITLHGPELKVNDRWPDYAATL